MKKYLFQSFLSSTCGVFTGIYLCVLQFYNNSVYNFPLQGAILLTLVVFFFSQIYRFNTNFISLILVITHFTISILVTEFICLKTYGGGNVQTDISPLHDINWILGIIGINIVIYTMLSLLKRVKRS